MTADGSPWEHLGIFDVTSGSLTVKLSNDAIDRVVADAVRIEPISTDARPNNQIPIALDDAFVATAGQPMIASVLDNDSDPDGDGLSVILITNPAHGTLSCARTASSLTVLIPTLRVPISLSTGSPMAARNSRWQPRIDVETAYGGFPEIVGLTWIAPEISVSRTSGQAPVFMHVSASGTTFDGLGDAYQDLEYRWDFGDPAGQETITHPVTGAMINANSGQTGPEAVYVYRQGGSYTITLTVRGKNEAGEIVSASTTMLLAEALDYFKIDGTPTGGTYRLSLGGEPTADIPYNASKAQIQAAIEALPGVGAGNVEIMCRTNPTLNEIYWIHFTGELAGVAMPALTVAHNGLTGGTAPAIHAGQERLGAESSFIIVSDWMGQDQYFDPILGNDANPGTFARPKKSWNAVCAFLTGGPGRRALLKTDSTFSATATQYFVGISGLRIDAYDSAGRVGRDATGAAPIVRAGSGITPMWFAVDFGKSLDDVVISNVRFEGTAPAGWPNNKISPSEAFNGIVRYFYFDNCQFTKYGTAGGSVNFQFGWASPQTRDQGWWNCDFDAGNTSKQALLATDIIDRFFVVGGSFKNGNGNLTYDHHIYPRIGDHSLFRWIDFQNGNKSYAMNLNTLNVWGYSSRYLLIDGNDITGTSNGIDLASTNNSYDSSFDQVIIQNNALHDLGRPAGSPVTLGISAPSTLRLVVRDNQFWNNGTIGGSKAYPNAATDMEFLGAQLTLQVYRNQFHHPALNNASFIDIGGRAGGYVAYNEILLD